MMLKTLRQDLRYAMRVHFKNPKIAIVMIATLGIGIGCLTAIFTLVHSVLIRPLNYRDPQKLVRLYESNLSQKLDYFSVSPLNWLDWRQSRSFEDLGSFARQQDFNLTFRDRTEQISGNRISGNLMNVLGVKPLKGSFFSSDYDRPGMEGVAILSFGLWKEKFGSDDLIIGQSIFLNQKAHTIVAVMGPDFRLPFNNGEIYLPLSLTPNEFGDRSNHFLRVIGRLKPDVTPQKALQEVNTIAASLAERYPDSNKGWSISLRTLEDVMIPQTFKDASSLLFGAALLVLLISCLNAANLLTARMMGRHREISIRRAMGATAPRLLVQLFMENFLIALLSGIVGILLAVYGVELLHALHPENIPRLNEIRVDPVVMLFATGASFFTVVLFGTVSARQSLKQNVQEGLKEGSLASTTGKTRTNVRNLLVILEAALSLVLLICAGLLMKSFLRLQDVDLGFEPASVLAIKITTPAGTDSDSNPDVSLYKSLLEKARAIPGVENAAITSLFPMGPGNSMTDFSPDGPPGPNMEKVFAASYRIVSPGYFKTMKIRLLRGEYFIESHPGKSLIIDEFARKEFWPDQEPIGKRIFLSGFEGPFEIVGIVRQVKSSSVESEPSPMLYLSNLEVPSDLSMYLVARTAGNPAMYADSLMKTVRQTNPNLVTGRATPGREFVAESLSQRRFNLVIFGIFACVALIVASMGFYSLLSYSVSQRRHEIGIRMALGARRRDVVAMVIKEGFLLAAIGVFAGLFLSYATTRALESLLYFVSPTDVLIFQVSSLFLLLLGIVSSYLPARRASKVDPNFALRHE